MHGHGGPGELHEVGVVECEGERRTGRAGRYLVGALQLDLDGHLVVDDVAGGAVADVPVDAVVGEGLRQGAPRRGRDRVQVAHLEGLHAGGGGECAAQRCGPLGQQPTRFGLRERHGSVCLPGCADE